MKFHPHIEHSPGYSLALPEGAIQRIKDKGIVPLNLTIGDPKLPAFSGAKEAIVQDLQRNFFYNYPSTKGLTELRIAISDWAKRQYAIHLDSEKEILPTMGSKEAIFHLPLLFDWGRNETTAARKPLMIIPSPAYPVYQESASLLDIDTRVTELRWENNYQIDFDSLLEEDLRRCQIFWINYPHNPTGAGTTKDTYERLLKMAEQYNFLVCSDECYNDIYFDKPTPPSVLDFPNSKNWLLVRSLSKRSHMTGYRCGFYASKNTSLIAALLKSRTPMGVASPNFVQQAAISAWCDEIHVEELRRWYGSRYQQLRKALEDAGFDVFPSTAGFYLWCRYPGFTEKELLNSLLEIGIICSGGSAFQTSETGCIRLVFCLPDEDLLELQKRLKGWNPQK